MRGTRLDSSHDAKGVTADAIIMENKSTIKTSRKRYKKTTARITRMIFMTVFASISKVMKDFFQLIFPFLGTNECKVEAIGTKEFRGNLLDVFGSYFVDFC